MTISLQGLDKAAVLAGLYNEARPLGMGWLHYTPEPMSVDEAQALLDNTPEPYFDYLHGRVMKINLSTNELSTTDYNRDNGEGAAEQVIAALRYETTP